MRRALALTLVGLVVLVASCSSVTEIVVDVTTDLPVPMRADELRVAVSVAGGAEQRSVASLVDRPPPRRIVLVHGGGALGPVVIRASAHGPEGEIVAAERTVAFVPGRSVAVSIALEAACEDIVCPGGGECRGGRCVPACELAGTGCPDASVEVADAPPAPRDTPIERDAALDCTLDDGLCGVPALAAPGDLVRPVPCTAPPAGVTVTFQTRLPSGLTSSEDAIRVDAPGTYTVIGTASAPADCRSTAVTYDMASVASRPSTGRPAGMRRDLAARLDLGFVATQNGAFAVTPGGWRDLESGATGALPNDDLAAVTVRDGQPIFAAQGNQTDLARVVVRDDFTGTVISRITLPGAARTSRSLDVPLGDAANGDRGPLVVGSDDGLVLLEGPGDALAARGLLPPWDVQVVAATGRMDDPMRGAVWSAQSDVVRNDALASSGVAAFAGGAEVDVSTVTRDIRSIAVDDRGPDLLLWLCSGDAGVGIYELGSLSGAGAAWPAARATLRGTCNDVAVDPRDGSAWVATSLGLVRVSSAGELLVAPGLPVGDVAAVAVAWGGGRRQVWTLSAAGEVSVLEAGL